METDIITMAKDELHKDLENYKIQAVKQLLTKKRRLEDKINETDAEIEKTINLTEIPAINSNSSYTVFASGSTLN